MKRRGAFLLLIGAGLAAVMLHVTINPLGARVIEAQGANGDCVVLLHGLARTSHSLQPLARHLARAGMTTVNVDYPSTQLPVAELADVAVGYGIRACAARNAGRVHFVTHSLGGILVRSYLARHEVANLGRVVMLAPPNRGSEAVDALGRNPLFGMVGGPAALEIGTGPQSVTSQLPEVDYAVAVIAGTRSINPLLSLRIPGPDDGKVAVQRTTLDSMTDFRALPVTHAFIMFDRAVQREVTAFLRNGRFAGGN